MTAHRFFPVWKLACQFANQSRKLAAEKREMRAELAVANAMLASARGANERLVAERDRARELVSALVEGEDFSDYDRAFMGWAGGGACGLTGQAQVWTTPTAGEQQAEGEA